MVISENDIGGLHRLKAGLKNGSVAILPAYTIYGFSASLFDFYANKRIFEIKKRKTDSPFIVIANKDYIMDVARNVDRDTLEFLLDNNITVIVETSFEFPRYATKNSKTAFRVANTSLLKAVTAQFPITSTSINISGKESLNNIKTISRKYGCFVDIIVKGKVTKQASTIVKLEGADVTIVRKGCCADKLKEIEL